MAASNLLALIDDIATMLDDVATMTKVATRKTAGVLGDDLALNAEQVAGISSQRELPVVLEVAKGSLVNKVILVPAALLISWLVPWAITPLLMIGGAYLCYEGFEKVSHKLLHPHDEEAEKHRAEIKEAIAQPEIDLVALEREKVKGAIRTDFILSAEIIVITLGTVAEAGLLQRVLVLVLIALLITVGVYGLVAAIVKLDDLGLHLTQREGETTKRIGALILAGAPYLMRTLGIAGTIAMFLVGGGILAHGIHEIAEAIHHMEGFLGALLPTLLDFVCGLAAGALLVGLVQAIHTFRSR